MRSRNIKPGFFKNEELVKLPEAVRLLFIGLWCLADRKGRLEDRPARIKMEIYPCDQHDVSTMLDQLQHHAFIMRYEVNGNRYIQIVNFEKHQYPHIREQASTIPAPCKPGASTMQARLNPSSLNPESGVLNPDNTLAQAPKRKQFVPPTVEEVRAYCQEKGITIDAEHFVNFYGATGWMRGKTKITNWKLCVHTWKPNGGSNGANKHLGNQFVNSEAGKYDAVTKRD
jgi:hypothetical protein